MSRPVKKNLTKLQAQAIDLALAKISPEDPGFTGSDEIRSALSEPGVRSYLESWVYPLLEAALYGEGFHDQARYIEQDYCRVVAQRRNAEAKS